MNNRTKGNIALLITAFIWGSGFIAQKLGMAYVGPFTFNSLRQVLAGLVLLPYSMHIAKTTGIFDKTKNSDRVVRQRKIDLFTGAGVGGVFLAIASNFQQVGLVTASAGKVGFITAIYIVLVPIFGLVLGQRNSAKIWICAVISLFGFALMSLRGGFGDVTIGDWMSLASAAFFACQILAVNVFVTRSNAILFSNVQMLISGILGIICMFLFETPTMEGLGLASKAILYSAFIPTAIGFTLQVVGQKYTDATVASLIMSLEAVFAAVLGVLFLHEHMTTTEWLGCLIIFAATILAQLPDKNSQNGIERID